MSSNNHNKNVALIIIIALGLLLIYALTPYISAFLAAIVFYALLKPVNNRLRKKFGKKTAATLSIVIGFVIILIPLSIAATVAISEAGVLIREGRNLAQEAQTLDENLPVSIAEPINDVIEELTAAIREFVFDVISGITTFTINIIILAFILYYLLINTNKISSRLSGIIPFSKKNTRKLVDELSNITNSVVITTGLIAVLQGVLLGIGFAIAGFPAPVIWGFIAAILSFLPVIGPFMIWMPAGIIALILGQYWQGIFILVWGFILSNVDNVIRPKLQHRFGKIHPLISITGVFAGIYLFGFIGIFAGPLLLSYFFLLIKMYKEEYIAPNKLQETNKKNV